MTRRRSKDTRRLPNATVLFRGGRAGAGVAGATARLVLAMAASLAPSITSNLAAQPTLTVGDLIVLQESGDDYLILPARVVPDGGAVPLSRTVSFCG